MRVTHDCWKCELCRHIWLAFDNKPPSQCARCRKRGWNASGEDRTIEPPTPKTRTSESPNTQSLGNPARQPIKSELKPRGEAENASNKYGEPREATAEEQEEAIAEIFKDFVTVYDEST